MRSIADDSVSSSRALAADRVNGRESCTRAHGRRCPTLPSSGCDLAPSLGHGFGMPMGYLPFAALAAIHLGGPQGDTARLTVEDSRVDGTESGVPEPDRLAVVRTRSGQREHIGVPASSGHQTMRSQIGTDRGPTQVGACRGLACHQGHTSRLPCRSLVLFVRLDSLKEDDGVRCELVLRDASELGIDPCLISARNGVVGDGRGHGRQLCQKAIRVPTARDPDCRMTARAD
jgi:hypothetical protein